MCDFKNDFDLHSSVYILNLCEVYNITDYEKYKLLTGVEL